MVKRYRFLLYFLLALSSAPAWAVQERTLDNNGTAYASIAQNGMTRIAVFNDRIQHVLGPDGAYQLQEDDDQGAVFLHPAAGQAGKPFTVFLATENGQDYVLHLTPKVMEADTILVRPLNGQNKKAVEWESASPYTEAVTALMTGMATGQPPDNYARDTVKKPKAAPLGDIATITPVEIYAGGHLQGIVYDVANRTNSTITLTEREFYQPGDRAIALQSLTLAPQAHTRLYKAVAHG